MGKSRMTNVIASHQEETILFGEFAQSKSHY